MQKWSLMDLGRITPSPLGQRKFLLTFTKEPLISLCLRIAKNLKPNYFSEKFFIKDKDGKVIKKSENLNQLINKTSWTKLKIVK